MKMNFKYFNDEWNRFDIDTKPLSDDVYGDEYIDGIDTQIKKKMNYSKTIED